MPAPRPLAPGAATAGGHAGQLAREHRARIRAVLAKAQLAGTGEVRGLRHTMLDDSDANATRHARAVVGGVVGAPIGQTDLFISGGGPVAITAEVR